MRDHDWQIALLAPSTLRTMAPYFFDGSYERVLRRSEDMDDIRGGSSFVRQKPALARF
jgi:hypothetical protein